MSNPAQLSDRDLLSTIETLIKQERALTLSVLEHLNEVERRKLHFKLGYGSLYEYCIEHLCYSAAAAGRRIHTARCIRLFPEVMRLLESGAVNLSTIALVAPVLGEENCATLLGEISGKSQREVETIIARYRAPAFIRDRVKPVRVRVPVPAPAPAKRDEEPHRSEDSRCGSEKPPNSVEATPAARTKVERKLLIQFTASPEFMNMFAKVKGLLSHRLPANASFEDVFGAVMKDYLQKSDPVQRRKRREESKMRTHAGPAGNPRHIPAATRDQVFDRDGGRCTYVGSNGRRCNSTRFLQIDHIVPVARGGTGNESNLRLLCGKHNRLEAERIMGRDVPTRDP